MSIINYAQKEISFKIVYYGTGVAGKTANLQYIYRGLPDVNRGNMVSLATGDDRVVPAPMANASITSFRFHAGTLELLQACATGHLPPDLITGIGTATAGRG